SPFSLSPFSDSTSPRLSHSVSLYLYITISLFRVSISLCLYIYISLCLYISVLYLCVSMSLYLYSVSLYLLDDLNAGRIGIFTFAPSKIATLGPKSSLVSTHESFYYHQKRRYRGIHNDH